MKYIKERVLSIEQAEAASNAEMKSLRTEVNELEWRSRQLNLEVRGIPYAVKEDLLDKLNEVAQMIDIRLLTMDEVAVIHRLPAKPDKVPGIKIFEAGYSQSVVVQQKKA